MHDVLDIIRNVQSLYALGPTLGILKDFERVLDELDVYVFDNWPEGELLEGPIDARHFVTCSFMWPEEKMPDPSGGKRLLDRGFRMDRGYGDLRYKAFRIAHMGNIYFEDLNEYLNVIDELLLEIK